MVSKSRTCLHLKTNMMNCNMAGSDIERVVCLICNKPLRGNLAGNVDCCVCSYTFRKNEGLDVLQINLQHSKTATVELVKRMDRKVGLVTLCTEPWNYRGTLPGLGGLQVTTSSKDGVKRAAIVSSKDVRLWPIDKYCSNDIVVAAVNHSGGMLVLVSWYWDINHNVIEPLLEQVIELCQRQRIPLVIGGDSNAHSPVWGCAESNVRGTKVEELMAIYGLSALNSGNVSTFVSARAESIIDITLVNDWCPPVVNWRVDLSDSMSDHRYIRYNFNLSNVSIIKQGRNFSHANWDYFRANLAMLECPEVIPTPDGIDQAVIWLTEEIWRVLDEVAPKSELKSRKNSWWSNSLAKFRRELRSLWDRRCTDPLAMLAYGPAKKRFGKAVYEAKRQAWESFTSSLDTVQDIGKAARALRNGRSPEIGLLTDDLAPLSTVDCLVKTHLPDSVVPSGRRPRMPNLGWVTERGDEIPICDPSLIQLIFARFPNRKAPGADGIPNEALKALPPAWYAFIACIYNAILSIGYTPLYWRTMKMIFIPKPGRPDYSIPKAFRPITLSSGLLKGLEKWVKTQIESSGTMNLPNQFAFRRGCSTETAISKVYDELEKAFYNGKIGLAAFLDIEGAFDRVPFVAIRAAMRRFNLNGYILEWYDSLVRNRKVITEIKGALIAAQPGRGTPQGGVLSPLMWNLVIQDLLNLVAGSNANVTGFADDVCFTMSGIDPDTIWYNAQHVLNLVHQWGVRTGLSFNPSKTQILLFTRKKRVKMRNFTMGGVSIGISDEVTYLGINLSNNLLWGKHLSNKVSKAKKSLFAVRKLVGPNWGLSCKRSRWLYTAIVRPVVLYGSITWATSPLTQITLSSFSSLQRLAAMMVSGGLKTTPTAGLEVILDLVPIELIATQLAVKARARSLFWLKPTWDGLANTGKGHQRKLDELSKIDSNGMELKYFLWTSRWRELTTCRQTKLFVPIPDSNLAKVVLEYSRKELGYLIQVFTGHACLKYHLHKMGVVSDNICRLCLEEEESSYHVVYQCPALEYVRVRSSLPHDILDIKDHLDKSHPLFYHSISLDPTKVKDLVIFLLDELDIGSILTERVE